MTVQRQRINQDSMQEPKWDYPQSKVETEQLILRERGDMPVVLLRVSGIYDDQCHSMALARSSNRG